MCAIIKKVENCDVNGMSANNHLVHRGHPEIVQLTVKEGPSRNFPHAILRNGSSAKLAYRFTSACRARLVSQGFWTGYFLTSNSHSSVGGNAKFEPHEIAGDGFPCDRIYQVKRSFFLLTLDKRDIVATRVKSAKFFHIK